MKLCWFIKASLISLNFLKVNTMKWNNSFVLLALVISLSACNQLHEDSNVHESTTFITNDTIPEMRSKINPLPVATYSKPVNDPLNDWKFAVSVSETKYRFNYVLRMQYKEMDESDTLRIPNFGTEPVVEIHKGENDYSCIVGFLDKKKEFKEYKKVAIKGQQMTYTTLKRYFVGVYRNVIQ